MPEPIRVVTVAVLRFQTRGECEERMLQQVPTAKAKSEKRQFSLSSVFLSSVFLTSGPTDRQGYFIAMASLLPLIYDHCFSFDQVQAFLLEKYRPT